MSGSGRYDQKVSFVSFGITSDGAGGTIPVEVSELSTYARVIDLTGSQKDAVLQGELSLPKVYEIGVRHRNNFAITNAMKVKYRGEIYQIANFRLKEERQKEEWIILATSNVGN